MKLTYVPVLHFGEPNLNQVGFYMLAESQERADKIIEFCKQVIDDGYDPNDCDIDYEYVCDSDLLRIKCEVEKYYREKRRK